MAPAMPRASKEQVAVRVIERLKDTWHELEDVSLEAAVKVHLLRLPRRYALDIHNLEDLRTHMSLLQAAQSSNGAVLCDSRGIRLSSAALGDVSNSSLHDMDTTGSVGPGSPSAKRLRAPTFGSSFNLQTLDEHANCAGIGGSGGSGQQPPVYEISVSGLNRPRMLSRVSTALFDIGLNISEAHVFCTEDGFALDVFVVQGWVIDDAVNLNNTLAKRLQQVNWDDAGKPGTGGSVNGGTANGGAHAGKPSLPAPADSSEWEISESQLNFHDKIASGAFGVLYRGHYCGQEVAIKVLKTGEKASQEEVHREFAQELSILRKVRHKNIVQLIGAMTKPPRLCLVTEFMKGGSALQFLHKHAPLKLPQLLKLSLGVALGMDYLHKVNVVHRDLKTANLLMDENEVVKVADFGVARVKSTDGTPMTAETGTYRWMAPEVIAHQHYTHKCDVFSYGILLWELVSGGDIPYSGYTPLQAAVGVVQRGLRPTVPQTCHPVVAQVMQYCWQPDPNARPEFEQVVELLRHTESPVDAAENKSFFSRLRNISRSSSAKAG
ncbi:serine/threonine-protein kinase [bacterium]|nr:serine/threonine-protein kinase [bacterium]MDC1215214.1 serine/threonine-protein kinase [bacterium]